VSLLFLVVVLVVLGTVAAVAAGRWTELLPRGAERARDRSPFRLPPPERLVQAGDLADVRFAVVLRGYRPDEVEELLDRLTEELWVRDERIARLERGRAAAEPTGAAEAASPEPEARR
jgi:DivIVA domain-containing protein